MAAHESPRTTKLYDRTKDEITIGEVERIEEAGKNGATKELCSLSILLNDDLPRWGKTREDR
jgi:hypothetical protein